MAKPEGLERYVSSGDLSAYQEVAGSEAMDGRVSVTVVDDQVGNEFVLRDRRGLVKQTGKIEPAHAVVFVGISRQTLPRFELEVKKVQRRQARALRTGGNF